MLDWVIEHTDVILGAVLTVIGLWTGASWWGHLRAAIRIARVVFEEVEKLGYLENIVGTDKLAPFMQRFFELWMQKFGAEPSPAVQGIAASIAARESTRNKINLLADPK